MSSKPFDFHAQQKAHTIAKANICDCPGCAEWRQIMQKRQEELQQGNGLRFDRQRQEQEDWNKFNEEKDKLENGLTQEEFDGIFVPLYDTVSCFPDHETTKRLLVRLKQLAYKKKGWK